MLGGDAFGMHASGSGGQVRGISAFELAQYWFEGLGGERGKGYWRLSTFSGGAFGMHAIGSGGRMLMTICFTPLTIPFFWCEGRLLEVLMAPYPRRRLFWHACQRIEKRARGSFVLLRFHRSILLDRLGG